MAALVSLTTSVSFLECTGTGCWSANAPRVGSTRTKPIGGFRGYVWRCHHTKGCVTMIDRVTLGLHCFRVVIIHHRVCCTRKENTFQTCVKTAICLAKNNCVIIFILPLICDLISHYYQVKISHHSVWLKRTIALKR